MSTDFPTKSNRSRVAVLTVFAGEVEEEVILRGGLAVSALLLLKLVMLMLFGTATSMSCSENTQMMCAATL